QAQAQPAPASGPQGTPVELSPAQVKESTGMADLHNQQREETNKMAQAASAQQALLEEMKVAAQGFKMGAGSDIVGNVQSCANYSGLGSDEMVKNLADLQQFRKDAIQISQAAITAVSSREAYQGQRLIMDSLPGTKMSPQGFAQITDQLSSVNDYS